MRRTVQAVAVLAAAVTMAAVALLVPAPSLAADPRTHIFLDSEFGDPVGQGGVVNFITPGSVVDSSYADGVLTVTTSNGFLASTIVLAAPIGEELEPGTYPETAPHPAPPGTPGIAVTIEGRSCAGSSGQFTIDEAAFGAGGAVVAFSGRFEQRCDGADGTLFGEIRVSSSVGIQAVVHETLVAFEPTGVGFTRDLGVALNLLGTLGFTFGEPTIVGPDADAFTILDSECANRAMPAGSHCLEELRFSPTAAGAHAAWIVWPDDTTRGERVVALSGMGLAIDEPSCELAVASDGGSFSRDRAAVVANELLTVAGFDWDPHDGISLAFTSPFGDESFFHVNADAQGDFIEGFAFGAGNAGRFSLVARGFLGSCNDTVIIDVVPLLDVLDSGFRHDIKWLYLAGVTRGCTATAFCPNATVTRGQMAAFLVRALDLPATSGDHFGDDNGTTFEGDINRLAASGITGGCGARRFCPNGTVTREQMASFLARAFRLPSAPHDYFSDDANSPHQSDINRVAAAGLTGGCSSTSFCPRGNVTRGQMAAFLRRALD